MNYKELREQKKKEDDEYNKLLIEERKLNTQKKCFCCGNELIKKNMLALMECCSMQCYEKREQLVKLEFHSGRVCKECGNRIPIQLEGVFCSAECRHANKQTTSQRNKNERTSKYNTRLLKGECKERKPNPTDLNEKIERSRLYKKRGTKELPKTVRG